VSEADDDGTDRSTLDDPDLREQLLAHARHCVDLNKDDLSFLAKQVERVNAILAKDVHESVRRAAGHVNKTLAHHISRQKWLARGLSQGIAAVERVSSLGDAVKESAALVEVMKYQRTDDLTESGVLASELVAAVDAVEFAANTERAEELRKASGAMERILGGVTELREMGLSIGEIQATVDDFITQKTKHDLKRDFSLLGPVTSDTDGKGTKRNKRLAAKRREQLLEQDQWVLRFLNEFWWKYWRSAFERSVPQEHELNIECAREVIPNILDAEKEPQDADSIILLVYGSIRDRRRQGQVKLSRIRLADEHILVALDRLVQSGGANPDGVVRTEGDAAAYWTRHRAEAAGLKIMAPRLKLVPPEDCHSPDD
jgi:hypothetical protein